MGKDIANVGRGPFDRLIIEGFAANKSAEEVAEITGYVLSPAQCLARLNVLIRSKDVLEHKDRLALLLEDAYWLRNKLRTQYEKLEFIDKDSAATWLKSIDMVIKRVEAADAGLSERMMQFNELRAQEFVESLTAIIKTLVGILADRHPEIEGDEVAMMVLEAIPAAVPEVN